MGQKEGALLVEIEIFRRDIWTVMNEGIQGVLISNSGMPGCFLLLIHFSLIYTLVYLLILSYPYM